MVLAFFTGARPTNTFSSRDYDRRLLLLSALSSAPTPPPPPLPHEQPDAATTTTATVSAHQPPSPGLQQHLLHHASSVPARYYDYSFFYPHITPRKGRQRRSADQAQAAREPTSGDLAEDSHPLKHGTEHHRPRARSPLLLPELPPSSLHLHHNKGSLQSPKESTEIKQQEEEQKKKQKKREEEVEKKEEEEEEEEQRILRKRSDRGAPPPVAANQLKAADDDRGISGGALGRINPWLSACDLAQSSTVPDLQVSHLQMRMG